MTTLVAIRQPLEVVSMSKQPDSRPGKRLAATADYEHDDDFSFVRKPKKPKTTTTTTTSTSTTSHTNTTADNYREPANTSTDDGLSRRKPRVAEIPDSPPEFTISKRSTRPGTQDEGRARARARASPNRDVSPELPPQGTKIALPMSDTPIINRNKEMRKAGGSSNRRSSLGKRGRRASSLIDSGQAALPHPDVSAADFYKLISASEELPEPRRMKQLLTWCAQRALPEKPNHNTPNANVILGARAIQVLVSQDLSSRPDCTNWYNRDENAPKTRFLKPNPKNLELDAKVAALQGRIKRLQQEKEAWLSMRQPPIDQPSLFEEEDVNTDGESISISLPDFDLLDPQEGKMRTYLLSELEPFDSVCSRTEERIRSVQQSLEFEVDQLADNMHKLEQRVLVAGQQADRVLALSATRLKDREDREKKSAGTGEMPMMEVLRGLGRILPEGS